MKINLNRIEDLYTIDRDTPLDLIVFLMKTTGKVIEKDKIEESTQIMKDAKNELKNWEKNDPETLKIWNMMNQWVYEGFESTYKLLGVSFDKNYYESQTYLLGKDIIKEGLDKNVLYKPFLRLMSI